uniref:Uncharacterized protein n=1 Tax=Oryza rufipogon TaxID=4529 RepID=A0A0E0Q784_ORYRU
MATATVTVEEMKRRRRQPSGLDAARAFLAGAGRDGLVCVVKTMSWLPETGGSDALCVVSFLEASSRRSPVLFL